MGLTAELCLLRSIGIKDSDRPKISAIKIIFFCDNVSGRRTTLVITSLLLAGSGTACALLPASSDVYPAFAALRLLMGMGHVGSFMMAFTLSLEYVGPKARVICGCLIEVPFAVGKSIVVELQ